MRHSPGGHITIELPTAAAQRSFSQAIGLLLFCTAFVASMLMPGSAYAVSIPGVNQDCLVAVGNVFGLNGGAGIDPLCDAFNKVISVLTGQTGTVVASLAVAIVGMMALFGKLNWHYAAIVTFGIALVFGAGSLMNPQDPYQDIIIEPNPITAVFKLIVNIMNSAGGRAVGVLAAGIIGVGAMYGKVNWSHALLWLTGIGMIFGAAGLVETIWNPDLASYTILSVDIALHGGISPQNNPAIPFMFFIDLMVAPGSMGTAIASVVVVALGVAALLGKISWTRGLLLIAGIALLFGAADVMYILSGPTNPCTNTSSDSFTQVICGFMEELNGPMAKTIGTLAVMILGIMTMLGKVSWELALTVVIGITLVFGANAIVGLFELQIAGVTCSSVVPTAPSTGNAIADVLCYIILILYGPAGKALATVAVIMMGFGALMGKVSYSQAFVVAAGIAVTFGAPGIVKIVMPSANISGCAIPAFNLGGGLLGLC